jgi:hypothetical protein
MSIRAPRRSPHGDADPVLHRHRRIAEMRRWQSRSRRREGDRVLGLPRHSQSKLPRRPQSPDREPSFGSGASSAKGSRSLAREVDSCTRIAPWRYPVQRPTDYIENTNCGTRQGVVRRTGECAARCRPDQALAPPIGSPIRIKDDPRFGTAAATRAGINVQPQPGQRIR